MRTQINCKNTLKLMKLCKNGQLDDSFKLINECKQLNIDSNSSLTLSHIHFSLLLEGCIKSNKSEKYKSIWDIFINEYNIKPNHITYSLVIHAAAKCNDMIQIKIFLNEMFDEYDKTYLISRHIIP